VVSGGETGSGCWSPIAAQAKNIVFSGVESLRDEITAALKPGFCCSMWRVNRNLKFWQSAQPAAHGRAPAFEES